MPSSSGSTGAGYWYPDSAKNSAWMEVLSALRAYKEVERAMRARTRGEMDMSESDLFALRFTMRAAHAGSPIAPKDLSRLLGITTASTTALIDRLEKSGHLRRRRHPTDRRALELVPTEQAHRDVRRVLGTMHERMLAAAHSLTESEAHTVTVFLHQMASAIQEDLGEQNLTDPHGQP